MHFKRILFAALAAAIVVGCGGQAPTKADNESVTPTKPKTEESATKEGWQKVELKSVTLQLPKDLKVIDITSGDFEKIMAEAFAGNPSLKSMEAQLKQAKNSGMFEMFAFGETLPEGFTENINIVVEPLPSESITLADYEAKMKEGLQQLTGGAVASEHKTEGGTEFAVTSSELPMQLKGGQGKVASIGWATVNGGKAFVVTFTTLPSRKDQFMAMAAEIMGTFRVK